MASPYYPLNFFLTRPDVRRCLKDFQAYRGHIDPQVSQKIVLTHLMPWLATQGWDKASGEVAVVSQEMQGVLAWSDWALKGRRIVSVDEALSHAFEHSDCSDMHIADVLPEGGSSLYLHFAGTLQEPIAVETGAFFQGAYVISYPDEAVRVVLCSRMPASQSPLNRWRERYDLRIPAKYLTLGADEAIDYALADDLADLRAAQGTLTFQGESRGLRSVEILTARMTQGHNAYKKALRLILNALAYLKSYSQDSREGWPTQAPARLVAQAQTGSPKEKERGLSKLWALGFIPVTYLGETFAQTLHRNTGVGTVRAHWRRGHWRNQPHGPAMSLRKLIWLQPTLVGVSAEEGLTASVQGSPTSTP